VFYVVLCPIQDVFFIIIYIDPFSSIQNNVKQIKSICNQAYHCLLVFKVMYSLFFYLTPFFHSQLHGKKRGKQQPAGQIQQKLFLTGKVLFPPFSIL